MGLLSKAGGRSNKKSAPPPAETEKTLAGNFPIETKLAQFHQMHHEFNCVVLAPAVKEAGFCEKVTAMLDKTGSVIPLPLDRPLILFSAEIDRELIAHRLSKTLNAKILLSFTADNVENALAGINSLIPE